MSPQDKVTTERHARTLREIVKRPENKVCADCKHNGMAICRLLFVRSSDLTSGPVDPRWASWNMYVLVFYFFFQCFMCVLAGSFCVFAALVSIVEWAPTSAKSSQSTLTHGHPSRWGYVVYFLSHYLVS